MFQMLMLSILLLIPIQQKVKIPKDAVKYKRSHYKVFHEPMTWRIAKEYCEGMRLRTFHGHP